jgi:hypothetical protein
MIHYRKGPRTSYGKTHRPGSDGAALLVHHFTPACTITSKYDANNLKYLIYKKDGLIARMMPGFIASDIATKGEGPVGGPPPLTSIIFETTIFLLSDNVKGL